MLIYFLKIEQSKTRLTVIIMIHTFTTIRNSVKVSNDKSQKAQLLMMYDLTKGKVDLVDLLSTNNFPHLKSKRWLLNALTFLVDTILGNSKTILQDNKVFFTNFFDTNELGKVLVLPNIHQAFKIFGKIQQVLRAVTADRNWQNFYPKLRTMLKPLDVVASALN